MTLRRSASRVITLKGWSKNWAAEFAEVSMSQPTLDPVLRRLDHLERAHRRLKLIGAMVLIALAGITVMGQGPSRPRTIEAETFIVRDRAGTARAALSIGAED